VNGWQELISNVVTSAIWPVVVLILGVLFRDTLRQVLGRLKGFEGLGAKLELSETFKQLDESAGQVEVQESQTAQPSAPASDGSDGTNAGARVLPLRSLIEVARLSPAAAIMDAWREVEETVLAYHRALKLLGPNDELTPTPSYTSRQITRFLVTSGNLSASQGDLLDNLRTARNKIAHGQELPSEGQALAYVEAAAQLMQSINRQWVSIGNG
jgi:hypothetical protein